MGEQTADNLFGLLRHRVRLCADNSGKVGRRRRQAALRPVLHSGKRCSQIGLVMPVAVGSVRLVRLRPLGEQSKSHLIAHSQLLCRLLDLLIGVLPLAFLEGFDEFVHLALRLLLFCLGQEHARFDIHEIGRHGDKLAGDLHIHALHFVEIGQILLQNGGDLNILYFDFILAQQQQNHVQRAVEILKRFALRVHNAAEMVSRFIHADLTPKR